MLRSSMVVTDLDGTLLHRVSGMSSQDIATLKELGRKGTVRVIATGRSLYSAHNAIARSLPIDYLIFSSGAGIMDWSTGKIIKTHTMTASQVETAAVLLRKLELDFMVHRPIPDNHLFTYYKVGGENPDFHRRVSYYEEFSAPGNDEKNGFGDACQIVAIEPLTKESLYPSVRKGLDSLKVIRTTSPMDGASTWIEIFPPAVSKGKAAEWLRSRYEIEKSDVLAVGNDYNDLDLLAWAFTSYVVDDAPADLKLQYRCVRSSREDGFTEAVDLWSKRTYG